MKSALRIGASNHISEFASTNAAQCLDHDELTSQAVQHWKHAQINTMNREHGSRKTGAITRNVSCYQSSSKDCVPFTCGAEDDDI